MLRATQVGDVTEIKMGRSVDGRTALYWVAAYLIDGILIDTGCDYTRNELAEFLSGKQLSMIINTHYHEDHVGANALLSERFGLRALAHPETIRLMSTTSTHTRVRSGDTLRRALRTRSEPRSMTEESACVSSRHLGTAGATSPSSRRPVGYSSGDIWVGERPKTARTEEDLHQIIVDLRKFEELPPKIMFASLGKIVPNPRGVIERTLTYLEETRDKIRRLHSEGKSSEQIRDELFGRESVLAEVTQYQLSTKIFVESFLRDA